MRAITINPFTHSIEQIETTGTLDEIYKHTDCRCITTVTVSPRRDTLYLDDEGLFRDNQRFFLYGDYPQPLAGKGIIIGTTDEGDNASTTLSLEQVMNKVQWVTSKLKFSHINTTESTTKHPLFGDEEVPLISNTPVFIYDDEEKKKED